MNKALAFLDLFRKGSVVADPALWKNRAAAIIGLSAFLTALNAVASAMGYDIGVTNEQATSIATGIVTIVSLFSTFATSDKVGLPARPDGRSQLTESNESNQVQSQTVPDNSAQNQL